MNISQDPSPFIHKYTDLYVIIMYVTKHLESYKRTLILKLLQRLKIQTTYFGKTEEHTRQAHMRFCPRSSMIHKQMHSHQDSPQLEHFACLFQSPMVIEEKFYTSSLKLIIRSQKWLECSL